MTVPESVLEADQPPTIGKYKLNQYERKALALVNTFVREMTSHVVFSEVSALSAFLGREEKVTKHMFSKEDPGVTYNISICRGGYIIISMEASAGAFSTLRRVEAVLVNGPAEEYRDLGTAMIRAMRLARQMSAMLVLLE